MDKKYINRFHTKYRVDPETGCWIWQAGCSWDGMGRFKVLGQTFTAPRFSAMIHGLDTSKAFMVHTCQNILCVSPQHLIPMTAQEKMAYVKQHELQAWGERNARHKLTLDQIKEIRSSYPGQSMAKLAEMYGVSRQQIYRIINKRNWRLA